MERSYLIVVNYTLSGPDITPEDFRNLLFWLEFPLLEVDFDPISAGGIPLIKPSQDEEIDSVENCNEWRIDTNNESTIYDAFMMIQEQMARKDQVEFLVEGQPLDEDDFINALNNLLGMDINKRS